MKDDSLYLLNDENIFFTRKTFRNFMGNDNKMNENVNKFLMLTTELLKKTNDWNDRKNDWRIMNHCLQATKRKDADGNAGGHMSPEKK